jgi:hypothetical protein
VASLDLIEAALNSPLDWMVFEKMVCEVLANDDMPRLRKCPSYKDGGIDAFELAIYQDESILERIVQITSQRSQSSKVSNTLDRLAESGIIAKSIIFVFKHPVASSTRIDIQKQCHKVGILPDIRDQSYLVRQIAQPGCTIFARYFDNLKEQTRTLLETPDPLHVTGDKTLRAVLASLAAYVMNPHARLARTTLFEKTVLATVVSLGSATIEDIIEAVKPLVPEENVTKERVLSALTTLQRENECSFRNSRYEPTDNACASVSSILSQIQQAYDGLRDHVISACQNATKCDQATLGYIERNIRFALLLVLRGIGPLAEDRPFILDSDTTLDIRKCLNNDLPDSVAKNALLAFCGFVEDPTNAPLLALFARSYSSLSIRNLDPVGRSWQQMVLSRSIMALDSDAVLGLLIEELPHHNILHTSIKALIKSGITICISPQVIEEVVGHVERAPKTYRRFQGLLLRLSPGSVEANVWNTVAQGFYYASKAGNLVGWDNYWKKYYDPSQPDNYIRFHLQQSIEYKECEMYDIPDIWQHNMEDLISFLNSRKEGFRRKAQFRDEEQMYHRVEYDVRMALYLTSFDQTGNTKARGYLATEDTAFRQLERHSAWPTKQKIVVQTHAIPQLASFVCGYIVDDRDMVYLMFNPVVAAAAQLLEEKIRTLAAVGVDMRDESIQRIDWRLRGSLLDAINNFATKEAIEDKLHSAADVVNFAQVAGFKTDSTISELAIAFDKSIKEAQVSVKERIFAENALRKVALAMATSKKAKRRLNRILKEIGLNLADIEQNDIDEED